MIFDSRTSDKSLIKLSVALIVKLYKHINIGRIVHTLNYLLYTNYIVPSGARNILKITLDEVDFSKIMKFCANLSFMFTETSSILERYALAKEAGFKAVETGFPFGSTLEQVKKAKEQAGVEQILINLKTGDVTKGELGVTAVPGKEDEFKDNLNTTIEYAKAVGAKKVHIMAGKLEKVTAKNWETYESNLTHAANVLKTEGLLGVIEPINNHSVPNYFLNDFSKAIDIIKRIGSANLKLQLDIFHLQHICGDLSYNIKNLMPYVGHVQIAQVPSRNEPNTDGEINYKYILQHLENNGYSDWIGLEYKPAGNTKDGLNWIQEFGYSL